MEHRLANKTNKTDLHQAAASFSSQPLPSDRLRTHPIRRLQRLAGNQGVQRLIQAKLMQGTMGNKAVNRMIQCALPVSQPDDPLEREANQVASDVVRGNHWFRHQAFQRQQSLKSQKERHQKRSYADRVQRSSVPLSAARNRVTVSPRVDTAIQRAQGGGEKLPESIRQPMESAIGAEFDYVSIHAGAEANRLNQSLNACAFTTGKDIFFRHGEYNPNIHDGRELIAHELVHVCQQSDYSGLPIIQRREFGDAVRFDSLPGYPPRARVLKTFPDDVIALELYGDPSIAITTVEELSSDEEIISIDYDELLPQWRSNFPASIEDDISSLSFEDKERIALEGATTTFVREVSLGIAVLAIALLVIAGLFLLLLWALPASLAAAVSATVAVLGTITGIQFVGEAISDGITAREEFEQSVRTAITRQQLVEIGETFAHRRAEAATRFFIRGY